MIDSSKPLSKYTHENFAIQRAAGHSLADSWAFATGRTPTAENRNALKVSGSRVEKKVQHRIDFLIMKARQEKNAAIENTIEDVPDRFQKEDIIALFIEVSDTLRSAYEIAQVSDVPPLRLQQLRTVYADHTARMGKLAISGRNVPIANATADSDRVFQAIADWKECNCE